MKKIILSIPFSVFVFVALITNCDCRAGGLELRFEDDPTFAATSTENGFLGVRTESLEEKITRRARGICEANELTLDSYEYETRNPTTPPSDQPIPPLTGKIYDLTSQQIETVTESYAPKWKAFDRQGFNRSEKFMFASNVCKGLASVCGVWLFILTPDAVQKMDSWNLKQWFLNTMQITAIVANLYNIKTSYEYIKFHSRRLFPKELTEAQLGPGMVLGIPNPQDIAPHLLFKKVDCISK